MAMNKKFQKAIIILVLIVAVMAFLPGQGMKADNQQAIVATQFKCSADTDCPKCVGGGIFKYNESDVNFLSELSYGKCVSGTCELSDMCLRWDCGNVNTLEPGSCHSVRQTLLDNSLAKINDNPILLLIGIGLLIAFLMLD